MKKLTIGRNPESSIQVSEAFPRVSNNHATIELVNGAFFLTDHSSNGTLVNGQKIHHEQIPLTNGDEILLAGDYRLAWPVILNFFPSDDNNIRKTQRFDAMGNVGFEAAMQQAAQQGAQPQQPGGFPNAPQGGFQQQGGYQQPADPQGGQQDQMTTRWRPGQQPPFPGGNATYAEGNAPAGGNATYAEGAAGIGGTWAEGANRGATNREGYNPGTGSSNEAGQLNSVTQAEVDATLNSFSPAAAFGTWFWGLLNGVYWPLAIIPLSLVPFIGQVLSIFLCTYMGLNGNQLGWQKAKNISFPQWRKKQQVELYIGIVVFLICAAVQLFSFYWIMNYIL